MPQTVQAMMPLQVAIGALMTKSVGSLYRVRDIRDAPLPIRKNVKHREAVIMLAATVASLAMQGVLGLSKVRGLIENSPLARYAILIQSGLMALALGLGEITGRYVTPPLDWHEVEVQEVHETPVDRKEPTMIAGTFQAYMNTVAANPYQSAQRVKSPKRDIMTASPSDVRFGAQPVLKLGGHIGVPQDDKIEQLFGKTKTQQRFDRLA